MKLLLFAWFLFVASAFFWLPAYTVGFLVAALGLFAFGARFD